MTQSSTHFAGKSVDRHILERFSQGMSLSHESHGLEVPGPIIAFWDNFKTATFFTTLWLMSTSCMNGALSLSMVFILSLSLGARAAWTSWTRLEKLHRLLEEESYEIEHHREQERLELTELYQLKGFEEPLLTKVIDVLMSDSDRLLKVMLEEELGLSLGNHEHPLKIALYATGGALIAGGLVCLLNAKLELSFIIIIASALCGLSAGLLARCLSNQFLQAFVWNCAGSSCLFMMLEQLCILFAI